MERQSPYGAGISYEPKRRGHKKYRARMFNKGSVDLGRYKTAAEACQALGAATSLMHLLRVDQQGQGEQQPAPVLASHKVARAVQRMIQRSPQLYIASAEAVWNYVVLPEAAAAAAAAQDAQEADLAAMAAAQDEAAAVAAVAAAAAAAVAEHPIAWQQEQDEAANLYDWLQPVPQPELQPDEQSCQMQQAALFPALAVDAAAGAVQVEDLDEAGLHSLLDLLLDGGPQYSSYELPMSDVSCTAAQQPASSEDTTATSPKPAAAPAAEAAFLPTLLHAPVPLESQPQHPMLGSTAPAAAAAAAPNAQFPMGASSSAAAAAAAAAGPAATFMGLGTCHELMQFAGVCVEQLMELYHRQLVPLMSMPQASVRELLVQWLPAVRQSIISSGTPPSVQQAAMQLLSRMAHMLLFPAAGSSSRGSGYMALGGDVACEQLLCVVEGLMQSLEGLSVMCSSNSSMWMEPGVVASIVQLWCAQTLQQPGLPASCFIHQLLLHLGA